MNNLMIEEYIDNVYLDTPPPDSVCERCGRPAIHIYGAVAGELHNIPPGPRCRPCGDKFARNVERKSKPRGGR